MYPISRITYICVVLPLCAVREAVRDDRTFGAMPFQQLFWEIGMTRTTPASDWNGDFLMSGQTYSTARDFARFGLLYFNNGVWNGERILPEGWAQLVSPSGMVETPRLAGEEKDGKVDECRRADVASPFRGFND